MLPPKVTPDFVISLNFKRTLYSRVDFAFDKFLFLSHCEQVVCYVYAIRSSIRLCIQIIKYDKLMRLVYLFKWHLSIKLALD